MTAVARRRPGYVAPGAEMIHGRADHHHDTPPVRHDRPVPYDATLERHVLAAAIAGPDLRPDDLDPGDMYVPAHARLAEALLVLARDGRPVRRSVWRTRYGRTVLGCELPGLREALLAVGTDDVERDLDVASEIMEAYPGRRAELDRVRDLARRRRRMAELAREYAELAGGVAS